MAIIVRCPVCNKIKRLQEKPTYFFKCCGIAHEVGSNTIQEGYTRQNKKKKGEVEVEIEEKNTKKGVEIEVE